MTTELLGEIDRLRAELAHQEEQVVAWARIAIKHDGQMYEAGTRHAIQDYIGPELDALVRATIMFHWQEFVGNVVPGRDRHAVKVAFDDAVEAYRRAHGMSGVTAAAERPEGGAE